MVKSFKEKKNSECRQKEEKAGSLEVEFPEEDLDLPELFRGSSKALTRRPSRSLMRHPVGNKLEIMQSINSFNELEFGVKNDAKKSDQARRGLDKL